MYIFYVKLLEARMLELPSENIYTRIQNTEEHGAPAPAVQ